MDQGPACYGLLITHDPVATSLLDHFQQFCNGSVVTESLAQMRVEVAITGSEDEAASQLKGILAQFVLAMTARTGTSAGYCVIVPN